MTRRVDAVVVRSGFAVIAACRLAQKGVVRCMCWIEALVGWERLPRSPRRLVCEPFCDVGDGRLGLLDYRAVTRMRVIQGSGLGGDVSLQYFDVQIQPLASIFDSLLRWSSCSQFVRSRRVCPIAVQWREDRMTGIENGSRVARRFGLTELAGLERAHTLSRR
jgi:hypothetical protein